MWPHWLEKGVASPQNIPYERTVLACCLLFFFNGDLGDSNSRHLKKIKMFECLMNESQCNFRSVFWHGKVSIVEKGFPDRKNATESLAYKSKLFFLQNLFH